jgi:SH3 domain-containing YSC84-like protein 1
LNQLLAAPDTGIPDQVFTKAKCVAVVPSLVKGGFVFGAEHGRGVASCRLANGGWSAPAFFTMTGGSWGAQIGAEGVDLVMLIMNDNGMNQLLSSKFKVGGSASAAAGPVGRQAAADTSWKANAEVLTYSRSRGLFAGATLNGTAIKPDDDAMRAYYNRTVGFRPVLTGQVKDMQANNVFLSTLRRSRAEVNAQAH